MNFNIPKILTRLIDSFVHYFRFVAVAVAVIFLFVGYSLLIQPKWNEVKETGLFDYNNEQQLKVKKEKYLSDLKKSLAKFEKINEEDIDKLSKIIPSEKRIADLFVVVEDLVKKSGLTLDSIIFSEGQNLSEVMLRTATINSPSNIVNAQTTSVSKNIYILDIVLTVSGGNKYQDLKDLLGNIEKEQRIMDINSISFNPATGGSIIQDMKFGLNLRTYYFNNEE